jgi:hypothetical protein
MLIAPVSLFQALGYLGLCVSLVLILRVVIVLVRDRLVCREGGGRQPQRRNGSSLTLRSMTCGTTLPIGPSPLAGLWKSWPTIWGSSRRKGCLPPRPPCALRKSPALTSKKSSSCSQAQGVTL